jgi:Putative regulator of cell autolysis
MQWILRQMRWRAVLVRIALLTTVWLVVAFVFATEFYLSAHGMPLKISWTDAARNAFRDWFPWMLLSPVAVILAGRFRFDRGTWRRSLLIHLAACFFFTIAYEGLLLLAYPAPFVLSTGGVPGGVGIFSTAGGGLPGVPFLDVKILPSPGPIPRADRRLPGSPGFHGSVHAVDPSSSPFPTRSTDIPFESGNWHAGLTPPMSLSVSSDPVTVGRGEELSSLGPPAGPVGFLSFPAVSKWTQFFHLAASRTQFTVPIYLCIVCICWVIGHFQESGERERRTLELETQLSQANLQALKMQLQPHFLFNTLNAISSLIHENPKVADDMVGSLSQFLRTTLDVSSENEVPLRTELEFVDRYLEIQQTRFGDRLQIHHEMDSTAMDALVPPLIIQPLVENAIRYGIESREIGGTVTIRALQRGDILHLEVSDDGEGFKGGQLSGAINGVGLTNTKARLQELYGNTHQFKLTANHPTGASVKIELPFRLSQ